MASKSNVTESDNRQTSVSYSDLNKAARVVEIKTQKEMIGTILIQSITEYLVEN